MRAILTILIGIHGFIHLPGFFKAFGIIEFDAISQTISKAHGVVWLLAFILFAMTIILRMIRSNYWWLGGVLAVIVSQILIFNYWSDAKFGTIANTCILLATIIGYSDFSFKQKIRAERANLFKNSQLENQDFITENELLDLPPIVQKWLSNSGVIGKKRVSNVHLIQELQLKMKPEQTSWNYGAAEQYFTIQPPAFNWNITTKMSALDVVGRDKFEAGKGEMLIKLLSLIPVANAKNEEKVDQASLQRYLAEMVWFPSGALSQYISWETIDNLSAKATMEYKGTKGSGEFHFDKDGNFLKFVAMRYKDSKDASPTKWTVFATKSEVRNEIKIPVECEASWELESGQWVWLKLKIKDIQYDLNEMPVVNT